MTTAINVTNAEVPSAYQLNQVLVDYLKMTSWSETLCDDSEVLMTLHEYPVGRAVITRYSGRKYVHGFVGVGRQKDYEDNVVKPHYMTIVSGYLAGKVFEDMKRVQPNATCKRIDLQITVETDLDFLGMYEQLRLNGVNAKYTASDTKTVYIGSRQSNRYIRIYEKDTSMKLVRFEVEYKGDLADRIFTTNAPLPELLATDVLRIDTHLSGKPHMLPFLTALDDVVPQQVMVGRKSSENNIGKFYRKVVRPYLWKLFTSMEIRDLVIADITSMVDQAMFADSANLVSLSLPTPDEPDMKTDVQDLMDNLIALPNFVTDQGMKDLVKERKEKKYLSELRKERKQRD